ncbi:MAG: hypothetical protein SOH99_07140 [Acidipropionibacterium acidipropionici]|jgi:hypothetical protein|uniref:Uncharacterized protein n=2 Tax=Acidipropionibacterium acidipropionici TaxID=1748 RepID=A0A142KKU0_9ACTN|nr:hypothetical protein [Acidipropionibacterium acidipropionici]AFV89038.1 hypothetical protein PACID_12150 [Acidipropionibacterium acidipropionici ATCC 4875]ALN16381.1 hypothetical protein ASQ49_15110 [Acidipropionibacterium acidipropionici]AMS06728.1 hypothetical protein AXH35_16050 [Acidipropionibacterium acidipropionici]AOZ45518.1 hypothetical protein A8L58_00990 [Acidipropionibacterium acidipropionici]APZ10567.1 hypothetical protein BWX38_16405 [Acidipropionibacterium acidipropionici]
MSFSWILTVPRPTPAGADALAELGASQTFDSAEEADAWLGEHFDELSFEGVDAVTLADDGTPVRDPMSLAEG